MTLKDDNERKEDGETTKNKNKPLNTNIQTSSQKQINPTPLLAPIECIPPPHLQEYPPPLPNEQIYCITSKQPKVTAM